MNNQFEERLKQRIQNVFDNYEDGSADLGWQELRKKFPPEKDRRPVLSWLSSAAAMLIIGTGIWFFVNIKPEQPMLTKLKPPVAGHYDSLQNSSPALAAGKNDESQSQAIHAYSKNEQEAPPLASFSQRSGSSDSSPENIHVETGEPAAPAASAKAVAVILHTASDSTLSDHSSLQNNTRVLAGNRSSLPVQVYENNEKSSVVEQDHQKLSLAAITSETDDPAKTKQENNKKKVSIGIFAGSFINYAGGSESKLNLGAGLTSEIRLTKNLNLLTGISIAQNDLSYKKNEVPTVAVATFKASTTNHLAAMSVISHNLDQYDASLLGLDIPVNLKYTFNGKKSQFFVSAGVNSGTFINEAYTYHYSSSGPTGIRLPSSQSSSAEDYDRITKGTSGFDFAKMLNFSLGIGYPVGKESTLMIEPFIKYPLKSVGDENLRFGAEGINLRFNFNSFK